MDLQRIIELDSKYYMNTFGSRQPVAFESGDGIYLTDVSGKKYADFYGGVAVNCLGYGEKRLEDAICSQVRKVMHTTNNYYIEKQALLAEKLVQKSWLAKIFMSNSGAEANEGAFKLARMYFHKKGEERAKFVTLKNSFHGRTLATLAATGQEKFHKPYKPLIQEFVYAEPNDISGLEKLVDGKTCAVVLELIQGESGVHVMNQEFVQAVADLCEKHGALLIFDEIQTGIGRTGKMFAFEHFGIKPDILTLAKALGGGVPIGAIVAGNRLADTFTVGDHGTTFGGNAVACSAALAVLEVIEQDKLVENSAEMGEYLQANLKSLNSDLISEVRGKGLMIGIELKVPRAKEIQSKLLENGFLVGAIGENVIRLLPPLIVKEQEIDEFISEFKRIVG